MAAEIKPIKRSNELAPLSRDHHDGLLLAWKIKQGIKYGVEPKRVALYCEWFWKHHLEKHFDEEEQLLITVLPKEHPLMEQMFAEHQTIRSLLQTITQRASGDRLQEFGNALNDHIRFEERLLFQEVEKVATSEQLQQIARQLNTEDICPVWQDEFWVRQ